MPNPWCRKIQFEGGGGNKEEEGEEEEEEEGEKEGVKPP